METSIQGSTYKSSPKVLLGFFKGSRDKWKQKCKETKAQLKLAKNQNRAVVKSRDSWRTRVKELESEVQQLQRELEEQKCCRP